MHSLQAVYDVNTTGNVFHSIYELPDPIPHNNIDPLLNDPEQNPAPNIPTLLQNISVFFRPRARRQEAIPPMKTNDAFGDRMRTPIDNDTTRMYFINLNGLSLQNKAEKFRTLCEEMNKANVHLFAAAEHNLDTNKFIVRQSLQNIARKTFQHHAIQTATSSTLADKFYKPGGTMLMAQGNLVGRIKERGSDSLGRWTWMKLIGKNKKLITIISAYQVCMRPTNITGTTAYHQQESLLRQRGIKKANPRKYFQRDLQELIRLCKTRNESIILMGDFNEPMNERSSMARIAATHQLVDILFQRNP